MKSLLPKVCFFLVLPIGFFMMSIVSPAQDLIRVQVTDSSGGSLEAHVRGISMSSQQLVWSGISDRQGRISLPQSLEIAWFEFSHVGYETLKIEATSLKSSQKIKLELSSTHLDAVEVMGRKEALGDLNSSLSSVRMEQSDLLKMQSLTLAGALEDLPGVQAMNVGVGISKPMIRGMSFNRILVTDSGIKQEGQQWGADHGLELDPHLVGSVEVLKGPASLIYGPDAMGGVLKVSPAPVPSEAGWKGRWGLDSQTNSGLIGSSLHLKGRHENLFFLGSFSGMAHGDYEVPANRYSYAGYILPIINQELKNTAGRQLNFSVAMGKLFPSGESRLTFSRFAQTAGIFTGAVGIPTIFSLEDDGDSRDIQFPRQINSHWKVISNSRWRSGPAEFRLDLGFQANGRREESLPHVHGVGPAPSGNLALGLNLQTYTANISLDFPVWRGMLKTGWMNQFMNNSYSGFEFLLPAYRSVLSGFFGVWEREVAPSVNWNIGLRMDGQRLRIDEHLQPVYDRLEPTGEFDRRNPDIGRGQINPSFSTGLILAGSDSRLIKINLGSGIRFPTPIELASNGIHHGNFRHEIGNANLVTERSWQADIGISQEIGAFSVSVSPFASVYSGFIYLAPSGRFSPLPGSSTLWEYRQNDALFAGGELQIHYTTSWRLEADLGLEYVWNQNTENGLPLPLSPPASVLLDFSYPMPISSASKGYFAVDVSLRKTWDQNRVARNEQSTPGYFLIDFSLEAKREILKVPMEFVLSARNLANTRYFNHISRYRLINIPEPGRNISFSVRIPFSLS